jgi:hypothetical protein
MILLSNFVCHELRRLKTIEWVTASGSASGTIITNGWNAGLQR